MKAYSWLIVVRLVLGSIAPGVSMAANNAMDTPATAASAAINGSANASLVNLNTADATTLETVKGLGATKAQAIVNYRQQHGNFATVADVSKVPGIGPKLLAKIQAGLTV